MGLGPTRGLQTGRDSWPRRWGAQVASAWGVNGGRMGRPHPMHTSSGLGSQGGGGTGEGVWGCPGGHILRWRVFGAKAGKVPGKQGCTGRPSPAPPPSRAPGCSCCSAWDAAACDYRWNNYHGPCVISPNHCPEHGEGCGESGASTLSGEGPGAGLGVGGQDAMGLQTEGCASRSSEWGLGEESPL